MNKGRMEAFSDGVIAILITIMVFDIKAPAGNDLSALWSLIPVMLAYSLSFLYLGIYWNNHHHMLQATTKIDGLVLWANLHLLFWLSLLPFATSWLRSSPFLGLLVAVYGLDLLLAALAYLLLQAAIMRVEAPNSVLRQAVGRDLKGKGSLVLYFLGITASFAYPRLAVGCYVIVAMLWLVPDRRIESWLKPVQSAGQGRMDS